MKGYSILITSIVVIFFLMGTTFAATLTIADFDSGDKPNNIGGDFGTWNKDEADTTQGCTGGFNPDITHGTKGYSYQLNYDVDSPNPAFNGFWMKLENKDFSQYDKLSVWIKGDTILGFSPKVKLELKNANKEVGKYALSGITKDWQQITIPLKEFKGLTSLKSMTELIVIFDDISCANKKTGTIYIDDIVAN